MPIIPGTQEGKAEEPKFKASLGISAKSFLKTKNEKAGGYNSVVEDPWVQFPVRPKYKQTKTRHTKPLASGSNTTSIYKIPLGKSCLVGVNA